jgi:hypothetical protein
MKWKVRLVHPVQRRAWCVRVTSFPFAVPCVVSGAGKVYDTAGNDRPVRSMVVVLNGDTTDDHIHVDTDRTLKFTSAKHRTRQDGPTFVFNPSDSSPSSTRQYTWQRQTASVAAAWTDLFLNAKFHQMAKPLVALSDPDHSEDAIYDRHRQFLAGLGHRGVRRFQPSFQTSSAAPSWNVRTAAP